MAVYAVSLVAISATAVCMPSLMAYAYNSPFVLLSTVCFFLIFLSFEFTSPVINYMAGSAFAVYLIHKSPQVWGNMLRPFVRMLWDSLPLPLFSLPGFLPSGGSCRPDTANAVQGDFARCHNPDGVGQTACFPCIWCWFRYFAGILPKMTHQRLLFSYPYSAFLYGLHKRLLKERRLCVCTLDAVFQVNMLRQPFFLKKSAEKFCYKLELL